MVMDLTRRMQNKKCTDDGNICMHFDQLIGMHKQLASMGKSMINCQFTAGVAILTTQSLHG